MSILPEPRHLGRALRGIAVGALAAAAAFVLPAPQASAFEIESAGLTVTATPDVASDYLFRGISQTRNRPALQGTLDIQHESGFYVGSFISNVSFPGYNGGTEIDGLFGYRREIAGIAWDLGGIWYTYPGSHTKGLYELSFFEVALKASKDLEVVKLLATAAYSPNAFGRSGSSFYLEGGADIPLPLDFTANVRLGHWWLERNERFGTPDYTWYSIGVTREIFAGITLSVAYYGTDIRKRECIPNGFSPSGQSVCDNRVLGILSKAF